MTRVAARPPALLAGILLLAVALRLWALAIPSTHHPDEIFQYLEAAHRIVFGYGVRPWETTAGIRSPLFPLLLAVPMAIGEHLSPGGSLYLLAPKLFMVLVSLALPVAGWLLGARASRTHAAMAAFVAAIWPEFVYFAPHTLSENIAVAATVLGAALIPPRGAPDDRRIVIAGLLFGIAGIVRMQFAPTLLVLALFECRGDWRRWRVLAIGAAIAALIGMAIDIASGATPFGWFVATIRTNLIEGRAAQYGTLGPTGYLLWFAYMWRWMLAPIAILAWVGGKRHPGLLWAGVVTLLFHSLIAHKEYRFVELTAVAFVLLAAIGSVDALDWARQRLAAARRPASFRLFAVFAALVWAIGAAALATGPAMRENWRGGADALRATLLLRDDRAKCGVALLTNLTDWGGYAYLHRDIAVSYFDAGDPLLGSLSRRAMLANRAREFDRIVVPLDRASDVPATFRRQACFGARGAETCVYARAGDCRPDHRSRFLVEPALARIDRLMRERRLP